MVKYKSTTSELPVAYPELHRSNFQKSSAQIHSKGKKQKKTQVVLLFILEGAFELLFDILANAVS